MQNVTLNVLNVGQGLCSIVTGIKDDGNPYCGIFDCGTLQYNSDFKKEVTLDHINDLINISGQKVITDIVISHQDIDHWSMLMDIISIYFEMNNGRLCNKNYFVCIWAQEGFRLFTVNRFLNFTANFEGEFENNRYVQKITYKIYSNEIVRTFKYEGIFYDAGKRWEIQVVLPGDVNPNAPKFLEVTIKCRNDAEKTLAKAYVKEMAADMQICECCQNVKRMLEDAITDQLKYDDQEIGVKDLILLRGHIRSICKLTDKNQYDFSDIVKRLESASEMPPVSPIQNFIWGGAKPGSECRLAQKIIEIMQRFCMIVNFSTYSDGGYVMYKDDRLMETGAMVCECYDSDMADLHGETMQQLNIMRNVTSVVTCMNFEDQVRFLFPGDLTVHRFVPLVEAVEDENAYMESIMIAPHHGSDVTNFCILQNNLSIQPLILLLDLFAKDASRIFIVSALSSKFGHPGRAFLNYAFCGASDGFEHNVCYGKEILVFGKPEYEPIIEETIADVFCTEMEQYGLCFSYPETQTAVCSERTQAPRRQCKAPSKRLFI